MVDKLRRAWRLDGASAWTK